MRHESHTGGRLRDKTSMPGAIETVGAVATTDAAIWLGYSAASGNTTATTICAIGTAAGLVGTIFMDHLRRKNKRENRLQAPHRR